MNHNRISAAPLFAICLLLICMACGRDKTLQFKTLTLAGDSCGDCPQVNITLPQARGKTRIAEAINTALREEVISMLTFEDSLEVTTLDQAVTSFRKGYEHIRKLYPDETPGWKAELFAEISYEDEHWVSIKLSAYTFTGGAHGYGSVRYLNFDKQKGSEVESWELFRNQKEFQKFAETRFRQQEQIPANQPINSTGFMFEDDRFTLPENIGLTAEGIKLYYNQYEVASYADGPIELTLPFGEVRRFLNYPAKS